MENLPVESILIKIERLQDIQKMNPPGSREWQAASDALQPLFAEMARRQEAGENITPIWAA